MKCPGKSLAIKQDAYAEGTAIIPWTTADKRTFKWIFKQDGSIESALCPGSYLSSNAGGLNIKSTTMTSW